MPDPSELEGLSPAELAKLREQELVERAQAAEPEPEPEAEPELEPEAAGELAELTASDLINQAHAIYTGMVLEVLGEDAKVIPCGLCGGYGFSELELLPDPHTERCPTCGGVGRTLTGSLLKDSETRSCEDCGGVGWRRKAGELAPARPAGVPAVPLLSAEEIMAQAQRAAAG